MAGLEARPLGLRGAGAFEALTVDRERHEALPGIDVVNGAEGDRLAPPPQHAATANHDLVRMVHMLLVTDVVNYPDVPAVPRKHEVTLGSGQPAAELGMFSKSTLVFTHSP